MDFNKTVVVAETSAWEVVEEDTEVDSEEPTWGKEVAIITLEIEEVSIMACKDKTFKIDSKMVAVVAVPTTKQ